MGTDLPDVLGMITGGARLTLGPVQCAYVLHPHAATIGQPIEALVLLQNVADKPTQVTLTLRLPKRDHSGNRVALWTPRESITLTLQAAETGLLHIPLVSRPPTPPVVDLPVVIKVETKATKNARPARPFGQGRPALRLNMSPVRLKILQDAGFGIAQQEESHLIDTFDIAPGTIPTAPPPTAPRYETLWSLADLDAERAFREQVEASAQRIAAAVTRTLVLEPLTNMAAERFQQVGFALEPAEALHMAKLLTFVMEDGLDLEPGFSMATSHWFRRLLGLVEGLGDEADPAESILALLPTLFPLVLHDGILLGLAMTARISGDNLGTPAEHEAHAQEVLSALEGKVPTEIGHAYLPLVLAGILLNYRVRGATENPWASLNELRQAFHIRLRTAGDEVEWVARTFREFFATAEETLEHARIPRPTRPPRPTATVPAHTHNAPKKRTEGNQ
jgi:hypothetical protein